MRILIIEDEKLLADSVKMLLERKGFEVECVYDGKTGEQYAELGVWIQYYGIQVGLARK